MRLTRAMAAAHGTGGSGGPGPANQPWERRRDARLRITRPVKLQCAVTGRYLWGQTCDLSAGGALMEIGHPSLLVEGQKLKVGIGMTGAQVVLKAEDLVEATIVRSRPSGAIQQVAVCFDRRQPLALAG